MQVGVITVDGRQVGVISLNEGDTNPLISSLNGRMPEGRVAGRPLGGAHHGRHHYVGHGHTAHVSDRAHHHTGGGGDDGGVETRGDRNNNPGNMKFSGNAGSVAKAFGAMGADDRGFAIFPNRESGAAAQEALIKSNSYRGLTLHQFAQRYAEGNADWTRTVGAGLGIGSNDIVDVDDPRLPGLIRRAEGTHGPSAVPSVVGGSPAAFIMHHTGGDGTPEGVRETLRERGLGVEYIMDRSGNIVAGGGNMRSHMLPGWGKGAGLSNQNTVGMEVIARDNADVTPAQVAAAKAFIAKNYPNTPVYGHGEVNPGHKEADEGMKIVNAIRAERAARPADVSFDPETMAP